MSGLYRQHRISTVPRRWREVAAALAGRAGELAAITHWADDDDDTVRWT